MRRGSPVPAGFGVNRWGKISRLSDVCRVYKIKFPLTREQMLFFTHLELEQIRSIILQHKGNSDVLRRFVAARGHDNESRKRRARSIKYSKVFVSD
jgi:hypothetical protein